MALRDGILLTLRDGIMLTLRDGILWARTVRCHVRQNDVSPRPVEGKRDFFAGEILQEVSLDEGHTR